MINKNSVFRLLGVLVFSALTACSAPNKSYTYSLNQQDAAAIDRLFNAAPSYCLGRYTFQYPDVLTQTLFSVIKIDQMTIESKPLYPPAFKQRIELREEKLKNQKVSEASDGPFLKEIIRLEHGVIFDRNDDYNTPDAYGVLESHLYINGIAFIITTDFSDLTKHKYKDEQQVYSEYNRPITEKPQKLAAMKSLISRLQGRANNTIPTEKGICIPNGFIQDDGLQHLEDLSMLFENNQFYWAIELDNTIASEKESMLDRADEIKPVIAQSDGKTLRKGKLQHNNIAGEEWLVLGREPRYDNQPDKFYYFQYYANEKNISYQHPSVGILMHTTSKVVNDYTDDQMVEIWDRVLKSFKIRPNAY